MKLLVCGHLRNFSNNYYIFVEKYFSKLNAESKHLVTYKNLGWWSAKNSVTDGDIIDANKIINFNFFDTINILQKEIVQNIAKEYIKPVSIVRPYLRTENMSSQFAMRYLSCKILNSFVDSNETIVLTRPDILPSPNMVNAIVDMIKDVDNDKSLVCYVGGTSVEQGDPFFVGTVSNLKHIMSSSAVNNNEYMDAHAFLDGAIIGTDIKLKRYPELGWVLCNSPNMTTYREI